MTEHVQKLCGEVWSAREEGTLTRDPRLLSQMLHAATGADVACNEAYDPETDMRVEWLREVIRQVRVNRYRLKPRACADAELRMEWALGKFVLQPCGKDRAAGR